MNILIDKLPESVMIDEQEYKINTDFRISIMYEMLMLDSDIPKEKKPIYALNLYYPTQPTNIKKALEAAVWFYSCGKERDQVKGARKGRNSNKQIYSFEHDDAYIFAAFWEQYGMDLSVKDDLHWWKFKSLFAALNDECQLRKIMGYRAVDISEKMSQEQKDFYRNMKEFYKIPLAKSEQDKMSEIERALLEGGDLSGIL